MAPAHRDHGHNHADLLGEQFSVFAGEALAWAGMTLATALEGWPDDDWSIATDRARAYARAEADDG
jgi:hypothetical protein